MIDLLLRWFAEFSLRLRYRIRTAGLEAVARCGTRGILFLPNHPALIDPIILGTVLHKTFRARFLADAEQVDRFFIRWVARRIGVIPLPDASKRGPSARAEVDKALAAVVEALRAGDNVVLYPAGHITHSRFEDLRGNRAVQTVLRGAPEARVVLVRTRGLWGSSFSDAGGRRPNVAEVVRRGLGRLLLNAVFFSPRRPVTIEFREPDDFPRRGDREQINQYLEAFYNADAPAATYVPYTAWEAGGIRELPEPDWGVRRGAGAAPGVPDATRQVVIRYLRERTGVADIRDEHHLARDLGLDSLGRAELAAWVGSEFGFTGADADALQTVGDLMLAACGESFAARVMELPPVPAKWFAARASLAPVVPEGDSIPAVFLAQARRRPGRPIVADQPSGVRTYRDLIAAVLVLKDQLRALEGDRLGIMLPASVAADVAYLSALFAGKTPVMVNWTVGPRNLEHCLRLADVRRIITSEALAARLAAGGVDLSPVRPLLVPLEGLACRVPRRARLRAWLRSRLAWSDLAAVRPGGSQHAVILFTSGSESVPKAVPLTHANILANVRDIVSLGIIRPADRLLGFLPPFHSFGLTVTTVLPLCAGVPVAHHGDPTEARTLGRLVEAYRTSLLVGTPTFLGGLARAASRQQLRTLRLAVSGAEKCPDRVHQALAQANPGMVLLEGYGLTECSPIVSVGRPPPRRGTVGPPLPSVRCAVVRPEMDRRVAPGSIGVLLVSGPSVFGGYLGHDGLSPFVEFEGSRWYCTGDLVSQDADGVLTFHGRLKRFVKLGGEMVSLPAIEAALETCYPPTDDGKPVVAVEATDDEDHPEIVLFTALPLDREAANRAIRQSGLSPLHNVRRVVRVDAIPTLGTGKADYLALKGRLRGGDAAQGA